jgi:hypothetical protein
MIKQHAGVIIVVTGTRNGLTCLARTQLAHLLELTQLRRGLELRNRVQLLERRS